MSETCTTEIIKHRIARTLEIQEKLKKLPYPSNVYDSCRDYVGFIRGYCEFKKDGVVMEYVLPECIGYLTKRQDKIADTFLDDLEKLCFQESK